MKVLIVHNLYKQAGGEDMVFEEERHLLETNGHAVATYEIFNESINGFFKKITTAVSVVFSLKSYREIRGVIEYESPDLVHVHNFFPLVSPAVFYACHKSGVPVVFTLHNYRIVCPTATLAWNGHVTEKSIDGGPWWALKARVYRNSFVGTFFLCLMVSIHKKIGTWRRKVTRFIALTDFAREKFVQAGLPREQISIKANFVDVPRSEPQTRAGMLFVGRLDAAKGIDVLCDAVKILSRKRDTREVLVDVIGDGPLAEKVGACKKIAMSGWVGRDKVLAAMRSHLAVIVPSLWYEGMPLTVIEAFASGTPVIASHIGSLAEMITDGVTGLLFSPGDSEAMAEKIEWAWNHPEDMRRMGANARAEYENKYTPAASYQRLVEIYNLAIKGVECGKSNHS